MHDRPCTPSTAGAATSGSAATRAPGLEREVIVVFRVPRRPEPTDPRARRIVEWADVVYYVFWLVFSAVVVVLVLAFYGPSILT
jgi:hypothetical protein